MAFGVLRLAAMGLAWYLLATTVVGVLARMAGWTRWSAVVDALSPAVVGRLLQGAAGLTVAATVAGTQAAAWATAVGQPVSASPVPIMRRLPSGSLSTTGVTARPFAESPAASQTNASVNSATNARTGATTNTGAATNTGDGAPRRPPAPAPSPTWVIRPGDNLWSVAEATLARAWGRPPSDAEVDSYWTTLVAANRIRLAHGDDPDLVFPGQIFELPAPPAAGQP
jgi:nucleoid-associated protein YgaU